VVVTKDEDDVAGFGGLGVGGWEDATSGEGGEHLSAVHGGSLIRASLTFVT